MSDLIEKLKGVSLGSGCLSGEEGNYLKQHIIHDIPQDFSAVKIIFLVESPHKQEVKSRHPLAGTSGHNVTKDLISHHTLRNLLKLDNRYYNISIGKLVNENKIPWLAIMNVSLLPLEKTAYNGTEGKSNEVRTLWCALDEIKRELERSDGGVQNLCPISGNVYEIIVNDLACRIRRIIGRCQPKFIPFGNVARRSMYMVNMYMLKRNLQRLPVSNIRIWHPSVWRDKYGNPNSDYMYRDAHLERVASCIRNHLPRT